MQFAFVMACPFLLVFIARGKRIHGGIVQKGMVAVPPWKWLLSNPVKGVRDELGPGMFVVLNFQFVRVVRDQHGSGKCDEEGYRFPHSGRTHGVLLLRLDILGVRALPATPGRIKETTREEIGSHLCCPSAWNHASKVISD